MPTKKITEKKSFKAVQVEPKGSVVEIEQSVDSGEQDVVDNAPYVYNSLTDFTLVLRPTRKVLRQDHNGLPYDYTTKPVKILFKGGMFVLDEKWSKRLGMEISEIRELLENAPGYPKSFRLVSGPGVELTEDMMNFASRSKGIVANRIGVQAVRGVRGTGAKRGR
jgi:hypothetical protein